MNRTEGTRTSYRVAAIPGDGIGVEVIEGCQRVLDAVATRFDLGFDWVHFDWSCERYTKTGRMMPEDGLEQVKDFDAIQLGAVGYPGVPDHISLWGLLIPLRRGLRQYINLRPIRLLRGIDSPLRDVSERDIDMVVIRENNEGEYSEIGGRLYRGEPMEMAVQESVFTRRGVERAVRYACEIAQGRQGRLISATKSNGIIHTMPFWDEIFQEVTSGSFPELEVGQEHVDALAAKFVLDPARFDVIVASNLFGDILTDIGAAIAGSIGIAPAANINPEREFPSMFEPVHGSAPDIVGQGLANPIGQIWCGAMMLDHLGHPDARDSVLASIEMVLTESEIRTPDIGGNSTTTEVVDAIIDAI
jgi:tartrate dehydrogenase/decarboxylase / D-malate dehydrogenase